jgi:hypothetical protein
MHMEVNNHERFVFLFVGGLPPPPTGEVGTLKTWLAGTSRRARSINFFVNAMAR